MTYEQWHARQLETQGKIDPEAAWKAGWDAALATVRMPAQFNSDSSEWSTELHKRDDKSELRQASENHAEFWGYRTHREKEDAGGRETIRDFIAGANWALERAAQECRKVQIASRPEDQWTAGKCYSAILALKETP